MKEWSVAVALGGLRTSGSAADGQVADLAEKLAHLAPAISMGTGTITVRVAVEAGDAAEAARSAVADVVPALEAVGLPGVVHELDVVEWSVFETRLEEPTYPELVGISEIAELLGISRQRASELARSLKFPAPLAELAAGPVWLKPTIARFAHDWDRKPGRPRTRTGERLQQIAQDRHAREGRV